MPLTLFGFHDRPNDIAATKVGAPLDDCTFLLDFTRPLERLRWLGVENRYVGPTVAFLVPVVHVGQEAGGYVVGVHRGEPYFTDLPGLWRKHYRAPRKLNTNPADGLQIVADFGKHFPEDGS
jgi:hypothetical protein